MTEIFREPVAFFLLIMSVILVTPLLFRSLRLPGIVGIILGGIAIGPHGLGLLMVEDRIGFLSTIGLIYLMFNAGLEVDLHQFIRVRNRALVFGALTFSLPLVLGMGLGWLLGLDWLGMILLGSAFSSHTLLAFPILVQLNATRNEAIAVTVGATVMTDIAAFVVLAIVLGVSAGDLDPAYFLRLALLLILFVAVMILGLPRLGKFFFQRFSGRALEFQFVLVTLFIAASIAELIGIHEVIGAFLAGLAINATLPRRSPVKEHVIFTGESFFVPIFLLYSGMITNPMTLFGAGSLQEFGTMAAIAAGVIFVAYASKLAAAWITGKIYRYSTQEFWTAFGLSHAQAAVTIPTLVIGMQLGLFDAQLFNAAILMILVTSITSPITVQHFAPGLHNHQASDESVPLFSRILVPVANPQTQENLLSLANLLARSTQGKVMVLNVVTEINGKPVGLQHQREMLERVETIINDPESDVELIPRIAASFARGILYTAIERDASLILVGWRGKRTLPQSIFGTVLDEVIWGSDGPVMVGKLSHPINSTQRILLILPTEAVAFSALRKVMEANLVLARSLNVPLVILADRSFLKLANGIVHTETLDQDYQIQELVGNVKAQMLSQVRENDLVVVPGFGSQKRFLSSIGSLHEQLAAILENNLIVLHFDR
jgi:Kef-type K+ transport system membrane component KefB